MRFEFWISRTHSRLTVQAGVLTLRVRLVRPSGREPADRYIGHASANLCLRFMQLRAFPEIFFRIPILDIYQTNLHPTDFLIVLYPNAVVRPVVCSYSVSLRWSHHVTLEPVQYETAYEMYAVRTAAFVFSKHFPSTVRTTWIKLLYYNVRAQRSLGSLGTSPTSHLNSLSGCPCIYTPTQSLIFWQVLWFLHRSVCLAVQLHPCLPMKGLSSALLC